MLLLLQVKFNDTLLNKAKVSPPASINSVFFKLGCKSKRSSASVKRRYEDHVITVR